MKLDVRSATHAMGVINLALGVSVIVGGAIRFPPPTYEPLLALTNGKAWPYGLLFCLSGILMMNRRLKVLEIGTTVGLVAHNLFAAMFLVAVVRFNDAGGTAWVAYAGYAALHSMALGFIMNRRSRDEED